MSVKRKALEDIASLDQFKEAALKVLDDYDKLCTKLVHKNQKLADRLILCAHTVMSVEKQLEGLNFVEDRPAPDI